MLKLSQVGQFLSTSGCHIVARKGQITFEAKGRYAMFCHTKEDVVFPCSSLLDALPLSPKSDIDDVLSCEDPLDSDQISYEDPNQWYVKVEFTAPIPPNTPKVKVPVPNESSMSNYCHFTQAILSMPTMEGFDGGFDLGVE